VANAGRESSLLRSPGRHEREKAPRALTTRRGTPRFNQGAGERVCGICYVVSLFLLAVCSSGVDIDNEEVPVTPTRTDCCRAHLCQEHIEDVSHLSLLFLLPRVFGHQWIYGPSCTAPWVLPPPGPYTDPALIARASLSLPVFRHSCQRLCKRFPHLQLQTRLVLPVLLALLGRRSERALLLVLRPSSTKIPIPTSPLPSSSEPRALPRIRPRCHLCLAITYLYNIFHRFCIICACGVSYCLCAPKISYPR
jgi:hypothetical protein